MWTQIWKWDCSTFLISLWLSRVTLVSLLYRVWTTGDVNDAREGKSTRKCMSGFTDGMVTCFQWFPFPILGPHLVDFRHIKKKHCYIYNCSYSSVFFYTTKKCTLFLPDRVFRDFELQRGHSMIVWVCMCHKLNVLNHTLPRKKHGAKNIILSLRKLISKSIFRFCVENMFEEKRKKSTFFEKM